MLMSWVNYPTTKLPSRVFCNTNKDAYFLPNHIGIHRNPPNLFPRNCLNFSTDPIVSLPTNLASVMDEPKNLGVGSVTADPNDKYSRELGVAVRAVHMACLLCQNVQENLISQGSQQVHSKDDNSPVTIAGNLGCVYPFWVSFRFLQNGHFLVFVIGMVYLSFL